jgi:hypothetical protein
MNEVALASNQASPPLVIVSQKQEERATIGSLFFSVLQFPLTTSGEAFLHRSFEQIFLLL